MEIQKEQKKYSTEQIAILKLIRTPKIGVKSFFELISIYKTAELAIENIKNKFDICDEKRIFDEIEASSNAGCRYVFWNEDEYPKMLLQISNYPPVLNVCGDISPLNDSKNYISIAIVGSRNASLIAKKFTEYISKELALRNFVVTSGMAYGIDSSAHESIINFNAQSNSQNKSNEIQSQNLKTIAVVGSGLEACYPNPVFGKRILNSGGALISEFSFFEPAKKENFPIRNRILSGISTATIVVEAKEQSGSMITARYAVNQGRLVFAVPGFPLDERSAGTNALIKDGAIMIRDVYDVLNEIDQFALLNYSIENSKKNNFNGRNQQSLFDSEFEEIDQESLASLRDIILSILDYKIPISTEEIFQTLSQSHKRYMKMPILINQITEMEIYNLILRKECGGFIKC